jgi:hypothetical protein
MEFGFNVAALFNADSDGIAILSGQELRNLDQKTIEYIFMVLDEIGALSAKVFFTNLITGPRIKIDNYYRRKIHRDRPETLHKMRWEKSDRLFKNRKEKTLHKRCFGIHKRNHTSVPSGFLCS